MARNAPFKERITRQLAILRGRVRRTVPGAGPRHYCVFMHMPKCGGTSLSEAMYATVPFHQRIGVIDAISTRRAVSILNFGQNDQLSCHEDFDHGQDVFDFREGLMLQHMAWDTMLIHGHVLWSDRAMVHFGDRYRWVTVLRDPIERTISNYNMSRRLGEITESFEEYLETPIAQRQAQVYLRYLSGKNDISEADMSEATDLAKTRLTRFDLIGFLDQADQFLKDYQSLFGVRLKMANLNTAPREASKIDPGCMARLTELCAADIKIFEAARALS